MLFYLEKGRKGAYFTFNKIYSTDCGISDILVTYLPED